MKISRDNLLIKAKNELYFFQIILHPYRSYKYCNNKIKMQ